jgi:serine/threonine-protein kinase
MPALATPERIGAYVIDGELGRGAHGVVYRAHHRDRPDAPVALKVVEGRGDIDRLLIEPAVLSRIDHPGVVGIEDYFVRGDDLILALEFVDGEDLKTLLDRGETFGPEDVRDLLAQLAGALAEVHDKSVIHRDIKPANILVVSQGGRRRCVLTDFGIGQVAEGIQVKKHTGGTFFFMAPEQLRGRPGPQSDLWALGVIAYRLLTGRLPFPGPTVGELSRQILYDAPVPPSQVTSEPIDPQLEGAVLRLLDKSLQERFASADELLQELGRTRGKGRPPRKARANKPAVRTSLDDNLRRRISRKRIWTVLCVLAYLLPSGLISAALMVGGIAMFARAQGGGRRPRRVTAWLTLLAFLLLTGHVAFRYFLADYDPGPGRLFAYLLTHSRDGAATPWGHTFLESILGSLMPFVFIVLALLIGVFSIVYLFLPVFAASYYASLRRLRREQLLRTAAAEGGAGSDRYLTALRDALDSRFEDVGFHLKYAEALFGRGRVKEAAAECRVLLRQDPYNFNGNLLLANAYHALGLLDDCVATCDRYLAVSGYCFEFGELREQCLRRLVPS